MCGDSLLIVSRQWPRRETRQKLSKNRTSLARNRFLRPCARRVLKPGDRIEKNRARTAKIEEGLRRSRVLVLRMSAHAFGSEWAQLESGTLRTGQWLFRDPLNKERRFPPRASTTPPSKAPWRNSFHSPNCLFR